jgi:hypothetical protein
LINNISTTDIEQQIKVEIYTQESSENYKWVCFILDKNYQNFEDLIKYSLWNNMDNPISGDILKINRDSIKGYWGYPSGFEFWIYIVVYKDEGMKIKESDKSISQFIFIRK